jgi:Zn-dependent protease with chaperone function
MHRTDHSVVMTVAASGLLLMVALAGSAEETSALASENVSEFTLRVTAELRAQNREAAELFSRANDARDREAYAEAEGLYREVLERQPSFFHATRRLCYVILAQGRRDEALPLCRQALQTQQTAENRAGLISALLDTAEGTEPTDQERAEARRQAQALLENDELDVSLLVAACRGAVAGENLEMLRSCVDRLEVRGPDEIATHYFAWFVAMSDGEFGAAQSSLDRAHALGLPDEAYAEMTTATSDARPWISRVLPLAGKIVVGWLGGLLLLLTLGTVLSRVTLTAARRPPTSRSGESTGLARGLRSTYRAVLFLSCVYYYVSIPIVFGVVLLAGGGIVYGFFAIGRIPIKLLAIVVLVVLVTLWAMIKSFFVRTRDEDPGDRLEIRRHPRLRRVLNEVARQIRTRPVDNVYMTPGTDLAVTERGGLLRQLRGSSERCLILGAGVLEGLKVGPFKAILAHEYGHFSNRDTAGGGFALAVRRSLWTMARALAEGGAAEWYNPAWLFVNGFHLVFLRISQGASRLQEILADRWAAFAYGARAFEEGLRHVVRRSIAFDAQASSTLNEVVQAKAGLSNLYSFSPTQQPTASEIDQATEEALNEKGSPYDSHPPPAERFALVHALGHEEPATPEAEEEVWGLFNDREQIERWMTDRIRAAIEADHGLSIPQGG